MAYHATVLTPVVTVTLLPPVVCTPALVFAEELAPSAWDPEPLPGSVSIKPVRERTPYRRRTEYETELLQQEIEGCRALLLELIRRAAFDLVLYRSSTRILQRTLAQQAYEWFFLEMPGHSSWAEREREGKECMSFLAICEALGLDPVKTRQHVQKLTPQHVSFVGRPASYRTRAVPLQQDGDVYSLPDGMVKSFEEPDDELM